MDERITRINTAEECEQFIINVRDRWPELVPEARRRLVELRAAEHEGKTKAEREALQSISAYEEALREKHGGKHIRATRIWQMVERHGIIEAFERVVQRPKPTVGFKTLAEMGLLELAFEKVVLRYPAEFSKEAVHRSRERLREYQTSME